MSDIFNSIDDDNKQPSIMVPMGDMDTAEHSPDTVDELAMELATIKQPAKRIAIIGSRNLAITHQQMIETLTTALVRQGNTIITSGGLEKENLLKIQKTKEWVEEELEKQGIFEIKEVYYAAYDGKELHFLTRESLNMKEKKRH